MEGIPARVSVVVLTSLTSGFPFFAYSVRYTAEKTPIGTAKISDISVKVKVFIIAGIIETFSLVYFHAKSEGFIFGIPFIRI